MENRNTTCPVSINEQTLDAMLEQETSLKMTDFDDIDYQPQPYGVEVVYSADDSKRKGRLRISSKVATWGVAVIGLCALSVGLYFVHHYPW